MPQEKKLVELGRVVHVTTGPAAGNIGAIVDIIDAKRLLVDGPTMTRQEIKLKDAFLTRIMLDITDTPSQKALREMWSKNLIDMRYKMTTHAKRIEKMRRRAECTDYEYFKVRCASRQANKIKANCLKNLKANAPRAMAKMERKCRIDMGVALGYRTEKKLTEEQKAVKKAREIILRANRITKTKEYMKAKKEKRAKRSEARKARIAKKKEAGTLKQRKFVPKEDRVRKAKKPAERKITAYQKFKNDRAARLKTAKSERKAHTKELQENRAAIKAAKAAGTKPPRKIKDKKLPPRPSIIRKRRLAAKSAKAKPATA